MLLSADVLDQTKDRTLIFIKTKPTAENAILTTSIVPIFFPIAVSSVALVNMDNVASRLSVLSAEIALGLELECLELAMDSECRKGCVGVQITTH
jgi:hypothetical protein